MGTRYSLRDSGKGVDEQSACIWVELRMPSFLASPNYTANKLPDIAWTGSYVEGHEVRLIASFLYAFCLSADEEDPYLLPGRDARCEYLQEMHDLINLVESVDDDECRPDTMQQSAQTLTNSSRLSNFLRDAAGTRRPGGRRRNAKLILFP